jgi:hypothetical protein
MPYFAMNSKARSEPLWIRCQHVFGTVGPQLRRVRHLHEHRDPITVDRLAFRRRHQGDLL